ncbi:MAG: glycosyltransferase family 2 protein [Lachnospiraceae bacterium]|nr:glycosyltransferase family 2 protein [Lachnospiraceae bacterium]
MTKISVVIPLYNGEKYIAKTIQNVQKQNMSDWELIICDNNSLDESKAIVEQFLDDTRITLVTCEKPGPSAARNKGLEKVTGKYVVFMDADDDVNDSYLQTLLQSIEQEGVDMSACLYDTIHHGKVVFEHPFEPLFYTNEEMIERLFQIEFYQGFIWNKMFSADLIRKYNLKFDESVFYNEDRLFQVSYLMHCRKVAFSNSREYHYCLRESSAMGEQREHQKNVATDKETTEIEAFLKMGKLLKEKPELRKTCYDDMMFSTFRMFRKMLSSEHWFLYRKHKLRKLARKMMHIPFEAPTEEQRILRNKLIQYGFFGVTYTSNPDFFKDEKDR